MTVLFIRSATALPKVHFTRTGNLSVLTGPSALVTSAEDCIAKQNSRPGPACMRQPSERTSIRTGCHSLMPSEWCDGSSLGSLLRFPPREWHLLHKEVLDETLGVRLPERKGRRNPRGVKRKMSGFPIRTRHMMKQAVRKSDIQAIILLK
jgi:hypothetical protein